MLDLLFLWHPGTDNIFSGYGIEVRPAHLVGLLMIDRPALAEPSMLDELTKAFGEEPQLAAMTTGGERGLVCQMLISGASRKFLRTFPSPQSEAIKAALWPLLPIPPRQIFEMSWNEKKRLWCSTMVPPSVERPHVIIEEFPTHTTVIHGRYWIINPMTGEKETVETQWASDQLIFCPGCNAQGYWQMTTTAEYIVVSCDACNKHYWCPRADKEVK